MLLLNIKSVCILLVQFVIILFLSSVLQGWVVRATPQSLYPWEGTAVPTEKGAGWVPDLVWKF